MDWNWTESRIRDRLKTEGVAYAGCFHAEYGGTKAVFSIPDGEIIAGHMPTNKVRLVQAWVEIHREDLLADWNLAVQGGPPMPIPPLQ